jgi:hypothetical protein
MLAAIRAAGLMNRGKKWEQQTAVEGMLESELQCSHVLKKVSWFTSRQQHCSYHTVILQSSEY